jgi:glycosyltransferase involved in cell wall biosynthesis
MPNHALVSISMIFLNVAESLRKAAESVLAQISEDRHVLLVDDGSLDESSGTGVTFGAQNSSRWVNRKFSGNTQQALLV